MTIKVPTAYDFLVVQYFEGFTLDDWMVKSKVSLLLTMGHAAKLNMQVKYCCRCKRLFYPGKPNKQKTCSWSCS